MCLRDSENYYGIVSRALHWGMALLIFGMLALGLYMEDLPPTPDKFTLYGWHKSFGMTALALAALRALWRLANPAPALPASMGAAQKALSRLAHDALYGFMFLMPLSGWLMSSAAGFPVSAFGWFTLPDLIAPDKAQAKLFGALHGLAAYGLMALLALHALAALAHHFYYKDDVLRRMLPGRRK